LSGTPIKQINNNLERIISAQSLEVKLDGNDSPNNWLTDNFIYG